LLSFALDSLRGQRHYAEYGGHHHKDRAEADKIDQFVTLWRLAQYLVAAHQLKISGDRPEAT
jgi:hypothetical protein